MIPTGTLKSCQYEAATHLCSHEDALLTSSEFGAHPRSEELCGTFVGNGDTSVIDTRSL